MEFGIDMKYLLHILVRRENKMTQKTNLMKIKEREFSGVGYVLLLVGFVCLFLGDNIESLIGLLCILMSKFFEYKR